MRNMMLFEDLSLLVARFCSYRIFYHDWRTGRGRVRLLSVVRGRVVWSLLYLMLLYRIVLR